MLKNMEKLSFQLEFLKIWPHLCILKLEILGHIMEKFQLFIEI